jgi:hypothetical protein
MIAILWFGRRGVVNTQMVLGISLSHPPILNSGPKALKMKRNFKGKAKTHAD